ncbi:MAG: GreA/GreB family elongation factor [Syntrophotaleaceae bacterium]
MDKSFLQPGYCTLGSGLRTPVTSGQNGTRGRYPREYSRQQIRHPRLEASYLAPGTDQSGAQEILVALKAFRQLSLQEFSETSPIRLTALVQLEDEAGGSRFIFLGPAAGGLCLTSGGQEIMVITPASPLGRGLLGRRCGDTVQVRTDVLREYEIVSVC